MSDGVSSIYSSNPRLASGKSRALMFIALDKLQNQGLKQAIIVVPERIHSAPASIDAPSRSDPDSGPTGTSSRSGTCGAGRAWGSD